MQSGISEQDIVAYYDQCERDYKLLWHLDDQSALHYGYWKHDTRLLREALRNMNDLVLEHLEVQEGNRILDAGCGVGGTSLYTALKYKAEVFGITLSQNQMNEAQKKSLQKANLKGTVDFSVQNFCHTNFKNEFFDGVFGIESICHAENKADFLTEAARVLKPGGRLVVADFFKTKPLLDLEDEKLIQNWANSWAVPSFSFHEDFIQIAEKLGFEVEVDKDISLNVRKSINRLYYCFFPGIICHSVLRAFGRRNKLHGQNVWSTYYQYHCFRKNLSTYRIMKFVKKENA